MAIAAQLPDLEHWRAQVKCQTGCPVSTDAGRYVQLIAEGRDEEAYLVARAPNPFASVCGRVCAAPCEDVCRRGPIDAPVSIRALKRYVTEQFGVESIRPDTQNALRSGEVAEGNRYAPHFPISLPPIATNGGRPKVAVIGAGPAGLSAAHDLALTGYDVTVFEAGSEPGGMLRYGIPEYRLPRALLRAEIGLALALVCWLVVVVLFDVAALGLASLLPSGIASRMLMTAAILNPVDAVRTGALLSAEGTTAFGGASLAFLRFAGGLRGAVLWPVLSVVLWTVAFCAIGARRVTKADI